MLVVLKSLIWGMRQTISGFCSSEHGGGRGGGLPTAFCIMQFKSAEQVGAVKEENVNEINDPFIHLTNIYSVPNTASDVILGTKAISGTMLRKRVWLCYHIAQSLSSQVSFSKICTASKAGITAANSLTTKQNKNSQATPTTFQVILMKYFPKQFRVQVVFRLGLCQVGPKGDMVKESVSHVEKLSLDRTTKRAHSEGEGVVTLLYIWSICIARDSEAQGLWLAHLKSNICKRKSEV